MPVRVDSVKPADTDARTARLFLALKPLYYALILNGVVPTAVKMWPRAALSFSPTRSTLLWALLVHGLALLSVYRVWAVSLMVLQRGGDIIASYSTFPALLAVSHTVNVVLVVPMWCEGRRYRQLAVLARKLVGCLEDDVLDGVAWPRRRTLVRSWLWILALVVLCPSITIVWQFKLTEYGGEAARVPAHWMSNTLVAAIVSLLSGVYYVIRDVAEVLTQRFTQDAVRELSCAELMRYRRAWLTLRDMLQAAMFAPVSVTLCCALLVVNTILCIYHVLNTILGGAPLQLTLGLMSSSSQLVILLIIMCCAADGAVDAVDRFAKSFECIEPNSVSNYAFAREVLREPLTHSPSSVCVGGFWYLNGRTVLSVCLMTLTYLIVLVEFRQQGTYAACGNVTVTCGDSVV